ncbi:MAG: hypothetical protein LYZ69_02985 [Nitrososphaerales archaeon]|nr:hypothetical protein [Nitrososphaerales archaeon]
MNRDLARLLLLRHVLDSVSSGRGVSASIVKSLGAGGKEERAAARKVLLGHPPAVSLAALVSDEARELSMLASLIVNASRSSARVMGQKGEALATVLEGWLKAREARLLEGRVLQLRGYIMCAVLGAVMAIISAIGPVVSSINFLQAGSSTGGPTLTYTAAALVGISSSMLGVFLSGKRFYVDLAVAMTVFALALEAASPLAAVPVAPLWGIK